MTICYNSSGVQQWISHFDENSFHDGGATIGLLNPTTLVVTGPSQTSANHWEYAAIKYNLSTGAEITSTLTVASGSTMDEFVALAIDEDENIYLAGSVEDTATGYFDYKTYKLNSNLQIVWEATFSGTAGKDDMAKGIGVDDSGNVYVTGFSTNSNGNKDYLTIKYNSSGTSQWTKKYDGGSEDEATDLIINEDNEVFVTGYTTKFGKQDYYTLLYDSSGDELWSARYNGIYNKNDAAKDITLDAGGNVLVSGKSEETSDPTYLTVKYTRHEIIIPPDDESLSKAHSYTENRGQLIDMNQNLVPFIRFYNEQQFPFVYLQDNKISLVLASVDTSITTQDTIHRVDMSFKKSGRSSTTVMSVDRKSDYFNYYLGHIPEGREQVSHYERLVYPNIYENIDLMLSSNASGTKYYFICNRGANPDSISLIFTGQDGINISNGDLHLETALEDIIFSEAYAFQIDANGDEVPMSWTPAYNINGGEITFSSGSFNSSLPLVIEIKKPLTTLMCDVDNTGILYSTYYGHTMWDQTTDMCQGATSSSSEQVFIVGGTRSINFPILGSLVTTLQGYEDAYVMSMVDFARSWVTHFGGNTDFSGDDSFTKATSIAYDNSNGFICFTGSTNSVDLPVTLPGDFPGNDYIGSPPGFFSVKSFLTKLNTNGEFYYGTYFGTSNQCGGLGLDVNNNGSVFLSGYVATNETFDLEDNNGLFYQDTDNDGGSFIAEFDQENRLIWSTRFSGPNSAVSDVIVDQNGDLFVTGLVSEFSVDQMDFAEQSGINDYYFDYSQGGYDTFIAKFTISENARTLTWSTVYGGDGDDGYTKLGINNMNQEVYMVGYTESSDVSFPLFGNYLDDTQECGETFIARFANNGVIQYSSLYGGNKIDGITNNLGCTNTEIATRKFFPIWTLAFDTEDNAYISIPTNSTDLTTVSANDMYDQNILSNDSPQGTKSDAFILGLDKDMNQIWATYYGGKEEFDGIFEIGEHGSGLIVINDHLYMSGRTNSFCNKIPLNDHPNANYFQEDLLGGTDDEHHYDAFISVFDISPILHTSINEVYAESDKMIVYPSPANDYIIIDFPDITVNPQKIKLFDALGRIIISKEVNAGEDMIELNTSRLPDGAYVVSAYFQSKSMTKKVIIAH